MKIPLSEKDSFADEDERQRAKQYKKDFPMRSLSWKYLHELEYLLDYHVDFGQMLKRKFAKAVEELKEKKITLVHNGDEGTSCFVDAVRIEEIDKIFGKYTQRKKDTDGGNHAETYNKKVGKDASADLNKQEDWR